MKKTTRNKYRIDRPIDVLYGSGQKRITLAPGTYSTANPEEKRFLSGYPGVTFLSSAADEPIGLPDIACLPIQGVVVTNIPGLQMKEKQAHTSARVSRDENGHS